MGAGTLRLFFAAWPDNATRESLADAATTLPADGRPVPVANLHLTLSFLGATPAEQLTAAVAAARCVRFAPLDLQLAATGYFPGNGTLWLGPESAPDALYELQQSLQTELRRAGLCPDERAFVPHVSLMRRAAPTDPARLDAPVNWRIDRFALVQSQLNPAASSYTVLEQFHAGD